MSARHEPIDAVSWQVGKSGGDVGLGRIVLERMEQETGPALYAVRNGSWVWNHRNEEWEYEPLPSSRTTDHLAACRFEDWGDAAHVAQDQAHELRRKVEERYAELARRSAASGAKGGPS